MIRDNISEHLTQTDGNLRAADRALDAGDCEIAHAVATGAAAHLADAVELAVPGRGAAAVPLALVADRFSSVGRRYAGLCLARRRR